MAAHGETSSVGGFQFSSPPVKMLAGKLRECTRRAGPTPSFWLEKDPSGGGGQLDVSLVWMQGTVIQVRPDRGTTLRLNDTTHTFTVCGADKVPKGKHCLEIGMALTLGRIAGTGTSRPGISIL
ncbi:hypothetical protein XENTR_v10024192 [Xenopus tropicalis]|nr:hypothetical protein XENTR_v10024192 [Xenopus tropicalis]